MILLLALNKIEQEVHCDYENRTPNISEALCR
jgi:hypothetical protein